MCGCLSDLVRIQNTALTQVGRLYPIPLLPSAAIVLLGLLGTDVGLVNCLDWLRKGRFVLHGLIVLQPIEH